MGLAIEMYEFGGAIPTLDAIETKVRELYTEVLVLEGTLESAEDDERNSRKARPTGNTVRMRTTYVTFRGGSDRTKWSTWLKLCASHDGTKLGIAGNGDSLFQLACDALVSLGGRIHRENPGIASRRGVPNERLVSKTQVAIGRAEAQADRREGIPAYEAFEQLRRKHFGK